MPLLFGIALKTDVAFIQAILCKFYTLSTDRLRIILLQS